MNMQTMALPLLQVQDLSVAIGQATVVKNVSFDLRPGEILGIVGESGSGKSITCRSLMGLLPGTARATGNVMLDGRQLLELSEQDWRTVRGREMGMIFQNPSSHLDPLKRIGTQIAAPMVRHLGLSQQQAFGKAVELLEAAGVHEPEKRARSYPHEFSGGMKQRAMIAAAIGCGPRILIADEPTTALDVTVQARILHLLKKLNRELKLAIILVSHDLGVVADICSHVVVMHHGSVIEQGRVEDVINSPRQAYTRMLIDSQPGRNKIGDADRSPETASPLLRVENLSVSFPQRNGSVATFLGRGETFWALNRKELQVHPGETVGVVGESGSGKSTLARTLIRLNRPSSGSVQFDGQDIHALSGDALKRFRQHVQMVFQNPYDSLNPRMTIIDAVAEPIWRHGLGDRKAAIGQASELLELVELPSVLRDRKPRQLSGGQCQRVGLARALALKPQLLIADEITSALDVTTQAQILELLVRLQRERNLALLYISHDLSVVKDICQRVYVFKNGGIVEAGTARTVLSKPQHPYTQELVSASALFAPAAPDASPERV